MELEISSEKKNVKKISKDVIENDSIKSTNSFSSIFPSQPLLLCVSPLIAFEFVRIPHLFYEDFYVYKYAASMSVSLTISERLCDKETTHSEKQREDYLKLLKAGCSKDPMDILMDVGINLQTPIQTREIFKRALEHFGRWVTDLEKLIISRT